MSKQDRAISLNAAIDAIRHTEINFSVKSEIDFTKHKREVQEIINNILDAQEMMLKQLPPVTPQPCEDAISRQAVIGLAYDMSEIDGEHFTEPCMVVDVETIQKLSPIKPQEPKTGHWIWQTEDIYQCSECGEDIHVKEVMNEPQYICCPICSCPMEIER